LGTISIQGHLQALIWMPASYLAHEPTDEERTLPWEEDPMGFVAADITEQKEITPASRLLVACQD